MSESTDATLICFYTLRHKIKAQNDHDNVAAADDQ